MYLNGAWDALSAYAVNALKETVRAISVYRKVSKMDEQTRLPTSSAGRLHVTDWAIGVVDDAAVASECARALEDEGFAAHEICIVPGAMALQQLQTAQWQEDHERILARTFDRIGEALQEGAPVREAFEAEAQAGHTFIGIHVPQSEQIDRVRNTLDEHQVHDLYLFWPTAITRLS
jgi:hypothetical protein